MPVDDGNGWWWCRVMALAVAVERARAMSVTRASCAVNAWMDSTSILMTTTDESFADVSEENIIRLVVVLRCLIELMVWLGD